jgi:hypothetical protein
MEGNTASAASAARVNEQINEQMNNNRFASRRVVGAQAAMQMRGIKRRRPRCSNTKAV